MITRRASGIAAPAGALFTRCDPESRHGADARLLWRTPGPGHKL